MVPAECDMPNRKIHTRRIECPLSNHITLTADRYDTKKLVCRLLSGHEGKYPRGRTYHVVMSCQGEHERWFEHADFFTPFPADSLVVETVAQASTLADLSGSGAVSLAQPTPPANLSQCAKITENAARLKCFDGLSASKK
jgi:hypothetical protein